MVGLLLYRSFEELYRLALAGSFHAWHVDLLAIAALGRLENSPQAIQL